MSAQVAGRTLPATWDGPQGKGSGMTTEPVADAVSADWRAGYADGVADYMARYGGGPVRVEVEGHGRGDVVLAAFLPLVLMALAAIALWYVVSTPHNEGVSP